MKLKKLIAWSSFWYNMQILNFYWSFSIKRSPSSNNIFAIIFKWTNNFSLIAPAFITFIRSDKNFSIVSILALKFASIWRTCGALLTFQVQTTFCNDRVVCTTYIKDFILNPSLLSLATFKSTRTFRVKI